MRHLQLVFTTCILVAVVTSTQAFAGWSAVSSGTSYSIQSIWGSSASDIHATLDDSSGGGGVLHYNGSAWSVSVSGIAGASTLRGIWGSSASDIYIAGGGLGSSGSVSHYDGTGWTATSSGINSWMIDVWGSSASDIFAVGYSGEIVHSIGSSWSAMTSGSTDTIYGVWGTGANDVYAVGDSGTILHYNGTSWSAMTSPTTSFLEAVWGSSATDIFAVGGDIVHYDGTGWSVMTNPTTNTLRDVWGTASNDVFAVGDQGTILHYDGTSWSTMTSGTYFGLFSVWGTSSSNVFAGGTSGTLLRYDGVAASTTTTTAASSTTTSAAANTAPSAAFTVTPPAGDTSQTFHLEPFASADAEDPIAALIVRIDWETDGAWDDQITADKDIDHQYTGDGTYTITIEVEDTGGLTDQASQQVIVVSPTTGNTNPTAVFTVSPSSGDTTTMFSFDASGCTDAEDAVSALKVIWDFDGDGMWDTGFSTTKTETWNYTAAGTYTVTLEVIDQGGLTDQTDQQVVVSAAAGSSTTTTVSGSTTTTTTTAPAGGTNNPPTAVALVHPPEGDTQTEFEFMAFDSSDPEDPIESLEFRWDFESDGSWDTSFDGDPISFHRFESADLYTATLEVIDSGGLTGTGTIEVTVHEASACPFALVLSEEEVETFRRFRDEKLSRIRFGRILIKAYYRASPHLRGMLEESPFLRWTAAKLLSGIAKAID